MGILGMEKWNEVPFELPSRDLQARLVDSGSKVGRAWQQGVPYDGFSTLSDEAVRLNLRHRLNKGRRQPNSHKKWQTATCKQAEMQSARDT